MLEAALRDEVHLSSAELGADLCVGGWIYPCLRANLDDL